MRRLIVFAAVSLAMVLPGHVSALIQSEPKKSAEQSSPRTLAPDQIDDARSRVYVHVGKGGLGHEHAVFGLVQSGSIHLGATHKAGTIVFDMASFAADTDEARRAVGLAGQTPASTQKQVTANMRGNEILDVQRYPTATFDIESASTVANAEDHTYELAGSFTLHGVQRPIRVRARAEQVKDQMRLRGNFVIRQSDFGIKPYSTGLGAIRVADELKIYGDIWIASPKSSPSH